MIQWFHHFSKSLAATVLMGGLTLSFVVWGIADVFIGTSSTTVATVGHTQIAAATLQREFQSLMRSGESQLTPDQARAMGYDKVALQQLVSRTALDNVASDLGIMSSDAAVSSSIRGMDAFKGALGSFDHSVFLNRIQSVNYTEDSFIAAVRGDMTRQQLTNAAGGYFAMPDAYARMIFMFLTERRAADYFVLTPEQAGTIAPPDDATLAAYVKSHAAQFSTPEYRDITYAAITPADVIGQTQVSDDQIKRQYDAHQADYVVPEKRDIEQIEFKTEDEAKAARAKIAAGTSFEAVAAAQGLKPADIDLGTLTRTDIPDADRANAAFTLAEGAVSDPVKSSFGWVLMRAAKVTPGISKSLDDVKDSIRTALAGQLAETKIIDVVNAYEDATSGGANLATAAAKTGMRTGHIAAVDAKGMAPGGTPAGVPADPEFLEQAFKADVGDDGDPFPAKSGAYYVIRVNGSTPSRIEPLEAVRAKALAAWTAARRSELLAAKAAALAATATHDKSLAAAAKSAGAAIQASPALARTASEAPFSAELVQKIFTAPGGGIVFAPDGKGDFIVARVTGILHPVPDTNNSQYKNGQTQLSSQMGGDFVTTLANAARARQGVTVNQALIDQTVGEGS